MSYKPNDLYVGVTEFFGVVLPGFILSYYMIYIGWIDLRKASEGISGLNWLLFFVLSYILGHFVFLLGSFIDILCDKFSPRSNDKALQAVGSIRASVSDNNIRNIVNHYKWCKAILLKEFPEGFNSVIRMEADSKFFRSLSVAVICIKLMNIFSDILVVSISLPFLILTLWRYGERRLKACRHAYDLVLSLLTYGKYQARQRSVQTSQIRS